jgi:signal transduction histidine kinase
VIDPGKLRDDLAPSPVLLKRVMVDEQTVASYGGVMPVPVGLNLQTEHAALELPPAHRRLDFEFAALSFGAPENVRFQYRLDGFDENWIEAGMQRVATYSRLPAGTYHFRVRGCNSSGTWNDAAQPLAFIVTPFIWQNWWFQLAILGVFTLSVIALVRYLSFRRLQLKVRALEQQAALDKERARIARDIHDDVGNRLTRITLLSGLALRDRTEPDKTSGHVQQISSAVRQVTDSLDEIVWAVNPRNDTLSHLINYIGQYAVEFLNAAGVKASVDLPDHPPERSVSADVRHNLFLVTKEALHNIVRHANAREVSLRVTVNGEWIGMSIEDDGRGFDRAPDNGSADGLRNMRQRMEEIGGEFGIESRPEQGTRISLRYVWRDRN